MVSLTPSPDLTGSPAPNETDVAATSVIATSDRATALAATAAAGSQSTASPTPEVTGTPTLTPTTSGTATVTPSVTPTSDPNATATVAVIPGDGITIFYESLSERPITAGDRQQWDFEGDADDVVTVSAAPGSNLDVALQLVDQTGATLGTADRGGPGVIETISQVTLPADGNYAVAVQTRGGTSGRYAFTLVNSFSTPFYVFQGNLAKGGFGSGSLREGTDHLWNYSGTAGERLTIRLLGTTENDLVLYVNGPGVESNDFESEELYFEDDDDLDEEGAADLEELVNIELEVTGIYTIGVGDNEFGEAEYTLGLE